LDEDEEGEMRAEGYFWRDRKRRQELLYDIKDDIRGILGVLGMYHTG